MRTAKKQNRVGGELVRAGAGALAPKDEPTSIIAVIARAAADPRTNVEKMQALLNMHAQIVAREAEVEFNAAMARLMPNLPRVEKDGVIFAKDGRTIRSRYAKYEDIDAAIRPLLAEEGFAISFDTDDSVPKMLKITGTLSHRMGHSRKSHITLPTESAVITGAQAVGATVSYGRRYIVCNLLNIVAVGEDNDAHGDPKPISADQVLTIETLLRDTNANVPKFLDFAGVTKIEDILERNYSTVLRALEAKRRRL